MLELDRTEFTKSAKGIVTGWQRLRFGRRVFAFTELPNGLFQISTAALLATALRAGGKG